MADDLTPAAEQIVGDLDEVQRIKSRQPTLNAAIGIALALIALAIVLIAVRSESRADSLDALGQTRDKEIAAIQQDLKGVCRAVPTASLAPSDQDACQRAEKGEPPTIVESGPPGRPPTAAEIQAAVATYFAAHPLPEGKQPTVEQVSAAVATYLVAHPVEPGRPPSADEISTAVSQYFEANPVHDGVPGRPPTAEEIAAAVRGYCSATPSPCRGQDGAPGPTCPAGYELRDTTITAEDGATYRGKVCVDPTTSRAPVIPSFPIPVR